MYATLQRPTPAAYLRPPPPTAASRSGMAVLQAKLANAPAVRALEAQGRGLNGALPGRGVVQCVWPELAAVGGLALGVGGLAYLHWRGAPQRQRGAMLQSLQEETETMVGRHGVEVHADPERDSAANPRAPHAINVNPEHPVGDTATAILADHPDLAEGLPLTARMHELTHVSVAEGYGGRNVDREGGPYNMVDHNDGVEYRALNDQAEALSRLVEADPALQPEALRNFLRQRIARLAGNSTTETDTVLNELVYYLHMHNIPARSAFSQRVVALARERQRLRAPEFAR